MNSDTDSFDEWVEPTRPTYLTIYDHGDLSDSLSTEEGADSLGVEGGAGHTLADMRRQVQALSRRLAEERRQYTRDRQRLIDENQRLAQENRWLSEANQQNEHDPAVVQKILALNEFGDELENAPDTEMTAQRMARLLKKIVGCELVCIYSVRNNDPQFRLLASAGDPSHSPVLTIPASLSPELECGPILKAVQDFQAAIVHYTPPEESFSLFPGHGFASILAAPICQQQKLRGLVVLSDRRQNQFSQADTHLVETAARQLLNTWQYAWKNEAITEFVQAVASLSIVQDTGSQMEMIASLARRTLNATYSLVATLSQQEWVIRDSGSAPRLLASLQNGGQAFLDEAIQSPYTFRLRDLRSDQRASHLELDRPELASMMASPIRINGTTTGILIAFGKLDTPAFTDGDVFIAERLAAQAAVNLESCYLNQEIRSSLKTTQLLYDLSLDISQAEDLENAARAIARTAYRLLQARCGGMILFSSDGRKEAEVCFPQDDEQVDHPYALIQQAMDSRQTIYMSECNEFSRVAIPIQTMRRCYGALWLELAEGAEETRHPTEEIRILVNQAAVALERSILLEETRQQANELRKANQMLIDSYDQLLEALMRALDARDSETEGHSARVKKMAVNLGKEMGLTREDLKALDHGALLHDIGKIGISDSVLLKPGPLDPNEWLAMRRHPQIGARIIQEIPALHDALPVIAFHQERWDGTGYPLRLAGVDIPLLARIFAVVDVYDALTSDRPYRTRIPWQEALDHLKNEAGKAFDPDVVERFTALIRREMAGEE